LGVLRAVLFDLYDTLVRADDAGLTAKVAACAKLATVDVDVFLTSGLRSRWRAISPTGRRKYAAITPNVRRGS
jgi:hypothetical protein